MIKEKKTRTDSLFLRSVSERGVIFAPIRFHNSAGANISHHFGAFTKRDGWDAGLEIPSDCLKQPSSTLVGLILDGKWLPFQSTNGIDAMGRDETEKCACKL